MKAYICDGCRETRGGEPRYTVNDPWLTAGDPLDGWDACSWACVEKIAEDKMQKGER